MSRTHLIDVALIFALAIFSGRALLFDSGPLLGEDLPDNVFTWKVAELSAWSPYVFFGTGEILFLRPYGLILKGFVHAFHLDPMRVFLVGIFALFVGAGLSMYRFSFHATKSRVAAITSAAVYMYGFNALQLAHGHPDESIGMVFLPLILYGFERGLRKTGFKYVVISALALTFFLCSYPAVVSMSVALLLLYFAFYILAGLSTSTARMRATKLLRFLLPTSILTFLLSAYWVVTLPFSFYWFSGHPAESAYQYSFRNVLEALVFPRPNVPGYFDLLPGMVRPVGPLSWILSTLSPLLVLGIPILAFSAVLIRRNRLTVTFTAALLTFMYLSMAPYVMPEDIFAWLWHHVPFYTLHRVGQRFSTLTDLSMALLSGITVSAAPKALGRLLQASSVDPASRRTVTTGSKCFLAGLAIFLALTQSAISSTGGFVVSDWPDSYVRPFEWIAKQPGYFRVLTLPFGRIWYNLPEEYNQLWGRAAFCHDAGAVSYGIHGRPVVFGIHWPYMTPYTHEYLDFVYRLLDGKTDRLGELLGVGAVGYIVAEEQYPLEYQRVTAESQRDLRVVERVDGSEILKNEAIRPCVFAVERMALVFGGLDTIPSLLAVEGFSLGQWALVFAHQEHNRPFVEELAQRSDVIVLSSQGSIDSVQSGGADAFHDAIKGSPARVVVVLEAEEGFLADPGRMGWREEGMASEASNGAVLISEPGRPSKAETSFFIPKAGDYAIAARTVDRPDGGRLTVEIDDRKADEFRNVGAMIELKWHETEAIYLDAGWHTLRIKSDGTGQVGLDELIAYSLDGEMLTIDEVFSTSSPPSAEFERPNLSKFVVSVAAQEPSWLVMGESYHPQWEAYVDGEELRHYVAYGYANLWHVKGTGACQVALEYWPQRLMEAGVIVSVASVIGCGLALLWPSLKKSRAEPTIN